MEEKIKVSLPKSTYEILIKDCENFDFFKNKLDLNKNLFINTLVLNYYEHFSASEEKLHDNLLSCLSDVPSKIKQSVFEKIIKIISKNDLPKNLDEETIAMSFKPTKVAEKPIEYIANVLIKNEFISSYYRRMFSSYAHHPQNEREKIIFKENYELLLKSISRDVKVCITLKNGKVIKESSVYVVSSSRDELFNYVLLDLGDFHSQTLRLAKIKNVSLLSQKRNISPELKNLFDRQIKAGIQYPINFHEAETIKVQLTEHGQKLFKKFYLYRPVIEKIEDDVYYFNCSYNQILHYFKRFGSDAIILEPVSLAIEMRNYYHFSKKAYSNALETKV